MLPQDQIDNIKQQLITHVNTTFPEDKKFLAINQIQNMDPEQLETFLVQNKLVKTSQSPEEKLQEQLPKKPAPVQNPPETPPRQQIEGSCIFCNLSNNLMKSHKIDENKAATAILDIHPITKGHTIIIPKKHVQTSGEVPAQAWILAKKIARKLKSKFKKATDVKVVSSNPMGHEIINVFPTYNDEHLASERAEPSEEELDKLQKRLEKKITKKKPKPKAKQIIKKQSEEKEKIKPKDAEENLWLPRRIP